MSVLLVVVSASTSPLSTDVPIPTDGQDVWWRCVEGHRRRPFVSGWQCRQFVGSTGETKRCGRGVLNDGPFPFTVAVWAEVWECPECQHRSPIMPNGGAHSHFTQSGDEVAVEARLVGAVVGLVEVTGLPHHAEWCDAYRAAGRCHPSALPDCWHTPTGTVTRIDPIPCDRPERPELVSPGTEDIVDLMGMLEVSLRAARGDDVRPSVWRADDDLAARIHAPEARR